MCFLEFINNKDVLLIKVEATVIDIDSIPHAGTFFNGTKIIAVFFKPNQFGIPHNETNEGVLLFIRGVYMHRQLL
jgi:hypothetical protein